MPTYEYECPQCGVFEQFQWMTEKPLTRCPSCRRTVRRLIGSGAGLLFKGNGFYLTDYRSESYKQAAKRESGGGSSESKNSAESKERK
jgi:putative FmdB family regulatory protein